MKLTSLLQLTEQHHFSVVRHFGLSSLDVRMITQAYQPMVGAFAAALYHTLCTRIPPDTVGRSAELPLSVLFLSCGLEPNEQGRKKLVVETSKLEAVGLLRSCRRVEEDGEVGLYEFRLEKPLTPQEFFDVHHLWILLKEKLGTGLAESVKRSFFAEEPHLEDAEESGVWEDVTAPFFEVFRSTVPPGTDLAMREAAPARGAAARSASEFGRDGFRCSELLRRFPRSSPNRVHVERLERQPELLAEINFLAGKFELTLKETVSLLDEDGIFMPDGRLDGSRFEAKAGELFLRSKGREHGLGVLSGRRRQLEADRPAEGDEGEAAVLGPEIRREASSSYWLEVPEQFAGTYDVRQYNALLVNSPYTRVLKLFFHPAKVPPGVLEAFLAMNVNYQLPDEVINVMIHYIRMNDLDWTRAFLEAIGANVAGKRITTFENAVTYFRKSEKVRGGGAERGSTAPEGRENAPARRQPSDYRKGRPSKPVIPIAKKPEAKAASEADIRRLLDKAKQLKDDR